MRTLIGCCLALTLLCLTAWAADAASVQSEIQSLESQLAAAGDPVAVKMIKAQLDELYMIVPPVNRSGSLDDAPANDLCADAITVAIGSTTSGTTSEATFDNVGTCGYSNTAPGVWYKVTGNGHFLEASTCNQAAYDTKISVFSGTCDARVCVGGNDDGAGCSGYTSKFSWCSLNGVDYLILVHGWSAQAGAFDLSINEGEPCGPPANDLCADDIPLAVPSVTIGSTVNATADPGPVCGDFNSQRLGVWYSLIGTGNDITVHTCDDQTGYDTQIGIYTGTCDALVCEAGNDDFCGLKSSVTFCSEFGVEYLVLVHGYQANTGRFALHVEDSGVPCGCFTPELIQLNILDALPLCQCIYICGDQPLTLCVGLLSAQERPSEISVSPGCSENPEIPRIPGEGCDDPECPPVMPYPISDWTYDADGGRWCITIASEENGCFCFCLDDVLPVQLNSFSALAGDGEVTLNWSTASESDNDRFEILRDGAIVGLVTATNSPTGDSYSWVDNNLVNNREYSYTLVAVSLSGLREQMAAASATPRFAAASVTEYALHQNFPNPFNPETAISFDIVEAGSVSLTVYNALGQQVASLVNGHLEAGRHSLTFEAGDLPSGIYFYRLEAGDFTANKKMVLMK